MGKSDVNASADNNNLGGLGPPSRSATPALSQDNGEGSFPNLQEHPYSATDLYVFAGGTQPGLGSWLTIPTLNRLGKQRIELVAMVQRQRDKWPWTDKQRKFNPSKTRYNDLKAALLNLKLGFTTTNPSMIIGQVFQLKN
jgi:hypothetical protein